MVAPSLDDGSPARAEARKLAGNLRARGLWIALFASVGVIGAIAGPSPPPQTAEGVAAMLGAAVGGDVRPDDFVWEARGGFWRDAFVGRRVLFLARARGSSQADLYRARVRLSRGGRPLALGSVQNLTKSPLGDDRDLVAAGHHAAYITSAFGAVQGITLLDLDGDRDAAPPRSWRARAAVAIDAWLSTGSSAGIGRTEVTFGAPPPEAREELQGDQLVMALGKEGVPAAVTPDGALNSGAVNAYEAVITRVPRAVPALDEVLVRATRELVGDAAASAVGLVASASDALSQRARSRRRFAAPVLRAAPLSQAREDGWPPASIVPPVTPAVMGEGAWISGRAKAADGAPPCVVETAVRPDPDRRESWVHLYALDTRQLDLRLVAGAEEPRSPTGLHGSGKIGDATIEGRAVAWFAAGPASRDATPRGFIANRRVMEPPIAGRATIAIATDGRVELGALRAAGPLPSSIVSVRQTHDALLGWTDAARDPLPHGDEALERSALGLTASGQLVYAWGGDVTAASIAKALELAGARFAVPLGSAPAASGFVYLAEGERADADMSIAALRVDDRSPGELLVAVRRAQAPPPLAAGTWAADGGRQPSPAWIPSVLGGTVVSLGAQVHLTSFAPGRLAFRIRAGSKEPATKAIATLPTALPEGEQARAVAAIGLAAGRRRGARGLVIDGAAAIPVHREESGALAIEGGRVRVLRASELSHGWKGDATELPLTADDGKLRPEAREVGTMRTRAAACVLDDGMFIVASTTFDSDEAATTALLEVGCSRVVALDRGTHQSAVFDRAGTGAGPEARYEATVLFALEVPLAGRAAPLE